jgi:hypothetical protein
MKSFRSAASLVLAPILVAGASAVFALVHLPVTPSGAQTPGNTAAQDAAALRQRLQQIPMVVMLPPDCTFQTLTTSRPHGAVAAVLDQIPTDLGQSVGVEYTPCSTPVRANAPAQPDPNVVGISFHIISAVRYVGSAGTVYATVDVPSAGALSRGLNLGSRVGTRPDGTALYLLNAIGSSPSTMVQWMHGGMVITVAGDLPPARLEVLADGVSVR